LTAASAAGQGDLALVTRPGEAGQRLSSALRDRGQGALWWPAFDLLAPAELEPLQALLQRLAEFDLAVFVSPAAVRGLAGLDLCAPWPEATRIAAAGASTLQLARSLLPGAATARSIALGADPQQAGSEALWEALQREKPAPRRALIVRADSGRDWLADRLRAAGCQVEYASVYRRVVHLPSPEQRAALAACRGAGDRAVSIVTSSEAVAALDRQLGETPDAKAWLRQGLALCSHPRIEQALRSAGYSEVRECEPTASGVLGAIAGPAFAPDASPAEARSAKAGAAPGASGSALAQARVR
jgi:uroporphyrinogen-III synthase